MRKAASQHPTRIVLFDWVRYGRRHSGWFQPDHAHLSYTGAAAFARLLAMGARFSREGQDPLGPVSHAGHSGRARGPFEVPV